MYIEYDAMEQLRRDLQKGAAEVARADRNRRRRARRTRARIRRQSRWVARKAVVAMRASARFARRWTAVMLRRSIRVTHFAVEHLERGARSSISAARELAARVSASRTKWRSNRTPLRMTADAVPDAPTVPLKVMAPLKPTSRTGEQQQLADDRDAHIAELDRRQLWLRENTLGADHPDVGLLALVVARRERQRGERLRARFLYERALTITVRSLGRGHPEAIAVAAELADLARETGDLEQAATWESWPAASTSAAQLIQS
jgi:hypothetical protein